MNNEIRTTDCDIYEVTLVVSIPNYGEGAADATALDYILNEMDSEITVLSSSEILLSLIPTMVMPTNTSKLAKTTQATLAEDVFEIDEYLDEDAEFNDALLKVALSKLEQPVTVSVVEAHLAKHAKPAVTPKKIKGRSGKFGATAMMKERQNKVMAVLMEVEDASADEIAILSEIPVKLVYNVVATLHKDKWIAAIKTGNGNKVRYSMRKIAK